MALSLRSVSLSRLKVDTSVDLAVLQQRQTTEVTTRNVELSTIPMLKAPTSRIVRSLRMMSLQRVVYNRRPRPTFSQANKISILDRDSLVVLSRV